MMSEGDQIKMIHQNEGLMNIAEMIYLKKKEEMLEQQRLDGFVKLDYQCCDYQRQYLIKKSFSHSCKNSEHHSHDEDQNLLV